MPTISGQLRITARESQQGVPPVREDTASGSDSDSTMLAEGSNDAGSDPTHAIE